MKPFEIQGAQLKLGGVQLEAGTTGVVIPGVTRATSFKVEEVEDTGDQDRTFQSAPMVIDYVTAQDLNNNGSTSNRATFVVELEDDGKIDGIEVDNQGSYTSQESSQNNGQNMLAYIGSDSDPLTNWNFQDWVTIPFAPKMRAGEVEREGGSGGASSLNELNNVDIGDESSGDVLVFDGDVWTNQPQPTIPTDVSDLTDNQGLLNGGSTPTGTPGFYITSFTHPADGNNVSGEAVAVDASGNSYVSFTYYSNIDGKSYGGVTKLSDTGDKVWSTNLVPNGNASNYRICSMEIVSLEGDLLALYGSYYSNDIGQDVGFAYYINPVDGSTVGMFDSDLSVATGMEIKDGIMKLDQNNNLSAVMVGSSYNQILQKTFTPLAGSTTDKMIVSWEEFNASGIAAGEQIIYTDHSTYNYGININNFYVCASPTGIGWEGLNLQVATNQDGTYNIIRNNGWSGVIYQWASPIEIRVLGSALGGTDGVNDLVMQFDTSSFLNNNAGLAAVSNVTGTSISDVYCAGWGGKDWSTEIGNTLTFDYQLGNQAFITRLGATTWVKNFGITEYERLNSVVTDSNDNIYAVGNFYNNGLNKCASVIKFDIDGVVQWSVYIDPANTSFDAVSVDIDTSGNLFVAGDRYITKVSPSDGSIIWQTALDSSYSWNGDTKGTVTADGNYIVTNYEDNDYTLFVICINGSDGSILWNKRLSRFFAGSNGEVIADDDFDAQNIDCNTIAVVVSGSSSNYYNNTGHDEAFVLSIPLDGQGVDGVYGEYTIGTQPNFEYQTNNTSAVPFTLTETVMSSVGQPPSFNMSSNDLVVTNVSAGTDAAAFVGIERHSTNQGDSNVTLADEHNGKFLYFNGSNGNSWVYVPSNSDVPLPIGYTVTIVIANFNGNRVYVNNNTGSQNAIIDAVGYNPGNTNYWYLNNNGQCGVYTLLKVDTDNWMLAGSDIQVD